MDFFALLSVAISSKRSCGNQFHLHQVEAVIVVDGLRGGVDAVHAIEGEALRVGVWLHRRDCRIELGVQMKEAEEKNMTRFQFEIIEKEFQED